MLVGFIIQEGYPLEQSLRVAEILFEAFNDTYIPIFHSKPNTLSLLQKYIRQDMVYTCIEDDFVIGVAGLAVKGQSFFNPSLLQVINILGLDVIHYLAKGSPLSFRVSEGEVNIDSLAVESMARNRGVGSLLVSWVCGVYRSRGYEKVSLHVIDKNLDAKRLYDKLGFQTISELTLPWPWSRIYGFKKTFYMVMSL
jgi:ribosomal protein S18 acetylase RimI-like enzyme